MKKLKINSEMIVLRKNVRYRILKTADKNYLLDTDQSLIWLLIPFMSWFVGVKIYEISNDESKMLLEYKVKKRKIPTGVFGLIILGGVIFRHGAASLTLNVPLWTVLVILISVISATVYMRYKLSKNSKTKEISAILSNSHMVTARIRFFDWFSILKWLFMISIAYYMLFLAVCLSVITSNIICIIMTMGIVFYLSAMNSFSIYRKCVIIY